VRGGAVERCLEDSWDRVIPLRIVGLISSRRLFHKFRDSIVAPAVLIGVPPVLAALAELASGRPVSWFIWGTATIYFVLVAVMVWGTAHVWEQVLQLGPDLDSMLEEADQKAVARRLSRALKTWLQISFFALGVIAATVVGIKLAGPLGSYGDRGGFAYRFTIAWTGGAGALSVYWLWGAPALFYPLSRVAQPKLDWVVPLQTPAVQKASRLTVSTSRLSTLGLLLFMLPIAVTAILASGEPTVWVLSVAPVAFAGVTVMASSVVPQVILEDLLRRGRRETLAEIRALLPPPADVFHSLQPQQMQAVELYRSIGNASVSTLDWKRFVEYLLLFLGAIIPLVIALADSF
jgi:hypothetical protein